MNRAPESLNELAWNAIGAGVIIAYYSLTSALLFLFIEKIGWYRVTPEDQNKGLDFIKHDDAAYHFGICHNNQTQSNRYPMSKFVLSLSLHCNVQTIGFLVPESRVSSPWLHLEPGEGRRKSLAIIINGARRLSWSGARNAFDVKPAHHEQTQVVS